MKKQRKFLIGGATVAALVGYLMFTGMKDSMVYYHTPTELIAKTSQDPTYAENSVKVGGRVVPGTVSFDQRSLDLRFTVVDIETGQSSFPVHYTGPLPDTFQEGRDVVIEGKLGACWVFDASTVLTM